MNAVSALAELSFESPDFYKQLGNNLDKMESQIIKLLKHENPKVRSRVASDLSMFEDEDGSLDLLERSRSILIELLNDNDLNVQKQVGFSLSVLSSYLFENKEDYKQYLEILSLLANNIYVLSFLKERTRFMEINLTYLKEISNYSDETIKNEAMCLIKIIESDINQDLIKEIEKEKQKNGSIKEVLFEAIRLIFDPTPENDNKALIKINKTLEEDLSVSDNAIAHYIRGVIYRRLNLLKKAKKEIEFALKLDPKLGDNDLMVYSAWAELTLIYEDLGDTKNTINTFQEGINSLQTLFNPEKIKRLLAEAYLKFALFYARNQKIKSSEEKFLLNLQEAIELDSEFPDLYFFLGTYYHDKQLFYRAIENYERYLELVSYDIPENIPKIEEAKESLEELKGSFEGAVDLKERYGIKIGKKEKLRLSKETIKLQETRVKFKTPVERIELKRGVDFVGGYIRYKIVIKNKTEMAINNLEISLRMTAEHIRVIDIKPRVYKKEDRAKISSMSPEQSESIDFYLEPLICGSIPVTPIAIYIDAFGETQMIKREPLFVVSKCPLIINTGEENIAKVRNIYESKEIIRSFRSFELEHEPKQTFDLLTESIGAWAGKPVSKPLYESQDPFKAEIYYYVLNQNPDEELGHREIIIIKIRVDDDNNVAMLNIGAEKNSTVNGVLTHIWQLANTRFGEAFGYMFKALHCPECGASFDNIDKSKEFVKCNYCKKTFEKKALK